MSKLDRGLLLLVLVLLCGLAVLFTVGYRDTVPEPRAIIHKVHPEECNRCRELRKSLKDIEKQQMMLKIKQNVLKYRLSQTRNRYEGLQVSKKNGGRQSVTSIH
jgi:hypothetical protein